jgi:hypothetical protein
MIGRRRSSTAASLFGGFTYYALCVYRPRSSRAQAVVASWRADPHFPRQVHTRDLLNFTLRHRCDTLVAVPVRRTSVRH